MKILRQVNFSKNLTKLQTPSPKKNEDGSFSVAVAYGPDGKNIYSPVSEIFKDKRRYYLDGKEISKEQRDRIHKDIIKKNRDEWDKYYEEHPEQKPKPGIIYRTKKFSDSLKIKVTRRETMKGDRRLGADGGSSRRFVTNGGLEFDDPVVTHWKGSTIVGYTNRKTGEIIKDPGKLFQQELDKIKKNK